MSNTSIKPLIFISYSHKDEPEHPGDGEVQWLSFVRTHLQPAVKNGIFTLWNGRTPSGADGDPEIERHLRACDIFVLLASANAMASGSIIEREIAIIRERQANGDDVHFFPLLLTPVPDVGLEKVRDNNLRPRDAQPFSGYSGEDRLTHMTEAANEIAKAAKEIVDRKSAGQPRAPSMQPAHVHVAALPETAYERLVGREAELARLDAAWTDRNINILSLVAEGGAGKSALVNEWLRRMQADNYRGAETVLGWSFYGQGSIEHATSADAFLNWAADKLRLKIDITSAAAKGEAIAEALAKRRILLILDGVEPLLHRLDRQQGELKDLGLRTLLRRFAAMPPAEVHGFVVLTSRLAVKDIARWRYGAAPVLGMSDLPEDAGAALLRHNGVWGTDTELKEAAQAFGGHPLALDLLASFLKETQFGNVHRRDRIRALLDDLESPRHGHVTRVLESIEADWLTGQPMQHAIMRMVGLFDRPATGDCMGALREKPRIPGLTGPVVGLDEGAWQRAATPLRDARLLAPSNPAAPAALDAHPLVREWFGQRLERTNPDAWRAAHGRLFEHLRNTTWEGRTPTLEGLAPLYQAIPHGCRAGRHDEVLGDVYRDRICRRGDDGKIEFYSLRKLGAVGSDLAALSWFFDKPYRTPVAALSPAARAWVLSQASTALNAQGRQAEALPALRAGLQMYVEAGDRVMAAAISAANLSQAELLVGEIAAAVASAEQSLAYAHQSGNETQLMHNQTTRADALHAAGRREEAERLLADAEDGQKKRQPEYPLLYSSPGYRYCNLLLAKAEWAAVRDRARRTLEWSKSHRSPLDVALDTLSLGRAHLGIALDAASQRPAGPAHDDARAARTELSEAVDGLRAAGPLDDLPRGLLARAALRRSVGDWEGAARDLEEVEEIAEPGPMRLYLCDLALERTRLALARIEAFAPLNGLVDNDAPKPTVPGPDENAKLAEDAQANFAEARELIESCSYRRRDKEFAELEAVLVRERYFADLPPRV